MGERWSLSAPFISTYSPPWVWAAMFIACIFLTRARGGRKQARFFPSHLQWQHCFIWITNREVSKLSTWKWVQLSPFDRLYLSTSDMIQMCQKFSLCLCLLLLGFLPSWGSFWMFRQIWPLFNECGQTSSPPFNFPSSPINTDDCVYWSTLLTSQYPRSFL